MSSLLSRINQWSNLLGDLGIFKNIRGEDAMDAQSILDQTPDGHYRLIFADGVLQDNEEIVRHCRRRRTLPKVKPKPRKLTWVTCPFEISTLKDPAAFKNFQYLLFNIRVHFESSFDTGGWVPDHRGLYARSMELKAQLANLSRLHNTVFYALKKLEGGENNEAQELLQHASTLHQSALECHHHRQLPDLFGILLMVGKSGNLDLQHSIAADLIFLARQILPQIDPRRLMIEYLEEIDWSQLLPLYLVFDSFCRSIWMKRAGNHYVKAYYSYNQARFPRADAGEFYSLYKGLSFMSIEDMLSRIDVDLGKYSHETVTLWHTAMEYLWTQGDYVQMGYFSQLLSNRFCQPGGGFNYSQDPQLNHDVSTTFLLLGLAQQAQGCPWTARCTFERAAQVRDLIIPRDEWDPAREGALNKLSEVDRSIAVMHTIR